MSTKLANLIVPESEPVGYRLGWAYSTFRRIERAAAGLPAGFDLDRTTVHRVLTCPGWWKASISTPPPVDDVRTIRNRLTTDIAKAYLEHGAAGEGATPIEFVREYLSNEGNFDALSAAWLHLQGRLHRIELANVLACRLSLLSQAWPGAFALGAVSLRSLPESLRVGNVEMKGSEVDALIGEGRTGVEVSWPGTVMLRLVPEAPRPAHLEEMAVDAIMHLLSTGCPPRRLVAYGLSSGQGVAMDVEREWLETSIGCIIAALYEITDARNGDIGELTPGEHCVECPFADSCPASEADEFPF